MSHIVTSGTQVLEWQRDINKQNVPSSGGERYKRFGAASKLVSRQAKRRYSTLYGFIQIHFMHIQSGSISGARDQQQMEGSDVEDPTVHREKNRFHGNLSRC